MPKGVERPQEFYDEVWRLKLSGMSYAAIAAKFGVSYSVIDKALVKSRRSHADELERIAEQSHTDKLIEQQRTQAQNKQSVQELRELTKLRAFQQELREALVNAALALEPPKLSSIALDHGPNDEETPVLVISDVHVGQATEARINAGYEINIETIREQWEQLKQAIFRIWEVMHVTTPWVHLRILMVGDTVEGSNMRASQARIVDLLVTKQTMIYGQMAAELVLFCLQFFKTVEIDVVPGNHGRTTTKPGVAGLSELDPGDSFDLLAAEFAASILKHAIDEGRVTMRIHESTWATLDVMGVKGAMEHGASLKGGGGWAGIPFYGITKLGPLYRELVPGVDFLVFGHYHQGYILPMGTEGIIIGNGSFPATTPYVSGSMHRARRPTQTLFSVHPRRKVTMVRELWV